MVMRKAAFVGAHMGSKLDSAPLMKQRRAAFAGKTNQNVLAKRKSAMALKNGKAQAASQSLANANKRIAGTKPPVASGTRPPRVRAFKKPRAGGR